MPAEVSFSETLEELDLVVNIIDTLSKQAPDGQVRRDQLEALTGRLRRVSTQLKMSRSPSPLVPRRNEGGTKKAQVDFSSAKYDGQKDSVLNVGSSSKNQAAISSTDHKAIFRVTKPSSVRAKPIPRDVPPSSSVHVSKEVGRVITCTLYNMLESVTKLLRASSANIFVRRGDEIISIANVAERLTFPPQLVRHRSAGSKDADVLASGIALNQRINDSTQVASSVLIFPIFSQRMLQGGHGDRAIATIHVDNKAQGMLPFDANDEALLYLASCFIGELMLRVPQLDFVENFYDPVTQHIVSPFKVTKEVNLPPLAKVDDQPGQPRAANSSVFVTFNTRASHENIDPKLIDRIENLTPDVMIKREYVPQKLQKPPLPGLTQMPTLREVRSFVDNMQDCWKKSVTSNVGLVESDRLTQSEIKQLRRELANTRSRLETATEQLRLYQLDVGDYKHEYGDLRAELDMYIKRHDRLSS